MDVRETQIFKFWEKYEHHLGVGALLMGFLFDLEVAKRPDSIFNNILLLCYLAGAGTLIVILNVREMRRAKEEHNPEPFFLLLAMQFCFGGLASNLLVLYGHSGTIVGAGVFLGMLVLLVLANEYFRNRYTLLRVNIGMYYFLLLSYLLIAVPVFITHGLGTGTFLLSGLLSLVFIGIFLGFLFVMVFRGRDTKSLRGVSVVVGGIFVVFNILYFINVIPPVPLSLKAIGVYHSLLHTSSGGYVALYERVHWWEFWRDTSGTYTLSGPQDAFCFSSVFAPTDLTTPVFHRWEEKIDGNWETQSRVSFSINGGRDEGYRGFSTKAVTPGAWRCDVETAQGQLIGRADFVVVNSSKPPTLLQTAL